MILRTNLKGNDEGIPKEDSRELLRKKNPNRTTEITERIPYEV